MRQYPRIGHKRTPRNDGGLPCIVCGIPTTGKVDIQVNYFRGDDEQIRVCAEHQKTDSLILEAFNSKGTPP